MSQQEIEQIEVTLEEARKLVDQSRMVERLENNPDFKKLILNGYFVEEASRLALIFSDPRLPPDQKESVYNDLIGLGALKRYLGMVLTRGRQAESDIEQAMQTREEIRQEEFGFDVVDGTVEEDLE